MDEIEKAKVYLHYCITQIALRHDIHFFNLTPAVGIGKMDKVFPVLNIGIKKVGKDHLILTREEFFLEDKKYHSRSPYIEWLIRFKKEL